MKILLADDEEELAHLLKLELDAEGFETTLVHTGFDAIKKIQNEDFDVVVSDIKMPGASGIEVLKAVIEKNPSFDKFFLISGFSDYSQEEALKLGAVQLISKPFRIHELVEAIRK